DPAAGAGLQAVAHAAAAQARQPHGARADARRRLLGDVADAHPHGADDPGAAVRPLLRLRDGVQRLRDQHGAARLAVPFQRRARQARQAAAGRRGAALVRLAFVMLAFAALAGVRGAHAEDAPGDSLLHAYVRSMSDSTDAVFGLTAAPVDTAGLDSSLADGL